MVVWTFSEIVKMVVCGLVISIIVGVIIVSVIKAAIHKLFYHDCRKCKHCQLRNVASCGDGADYGCDYNEAYERLNKNGMVKYHEEIWKRCNKFEKV